MKILRSGEADWKGRVTLWDYALCFLIPLASTLPCYPGTAGFKSLRFMPLGGPWVPFLLRSPQEVPHETSPEAAIRGPPPQPLQSPTVVTAKGLLCGAWTLHVSGDTCLWGLCSSLIPPRDKHLSFLGLFFLSLTKNAGNVLSLRTGWRPFLLPTGGRPPPSLQALT